MAEGSARRVVEATTEVVDASTGKVINAFSTAADTVVASSAGSLTFDMYCSVRKISVFHRAGMAAFTKVRSATLEEWDKIFKRY